MLIWECCPLIYSFKLCICQDPRQARAYTTQNTNICALLCCLVQRLPAFTSRCRTDKGGRGALEPPPENGARTKRFDREFQFRESYTEAETKKTPDRIKKRNDHIDYIFSCTASTAASVHNIVSFKPEKNMCYTAQPGPEPEPRTQRRTRTDSRM